MSNDTVKVKLVRSLIGRKKSHIACAKGLGLRGINSTSVVKLTAENKGMLNEISYLLEVEQNVS